MEPLVNISDDQLQDLRNLYQQNLPQQIVGYCLLDSLINDPKLRDTFTYYFYSCFGDLKHGFIAINQWHNSYQVRIQPLGNIEKIEEALKKTSIIDWTKNIMIPSATPEVIECLQRLQAQLGIKVSYDTNEGAEKFVISKETWRMGEISCPPNTYVAPLKPEHIKLVDETWTYHGEKSHYIFEAFMKHDLTWVLYSSEDHNPLAWTTVNEAGAMTHLYCLERHRRKGYAKYVTAVAVDQLLKERNYVLAYIIEHNTNSQILFKKLGFETFGTDFWVFTMQDTGMSKFSNTLTVQQSVLKMEGDPLVFVPLEKWKDLEKELSKDWPQNIQIEVLDIHRKWTELGVKHNFKVYCPYGDVSNGMVSVNKKVSNYEVIILCSKKDTSQLEEALIKSKLIDWSQVDVPFATENIVKIINRLSREINLKETSVTPCELFVIKSGSPHFDYILPQGLSFGSVLLEKAEFINSVWPHRHPNSTAYIQEMIKANMGYGLYKDQDLVGWVFVRENGPLLHLYVVDEHRRKGYAQIILKYITNVLLDNNKDTFAYCVAGNYKAVALYRKLDFKSGGIVNFFNLEKVNKVESLKSCACPTSFYINYH